MTSRWKWLSRNSRADQPDPAADAALTTAFLDMEQRQAFIESAVQNAIAWSPGTRLASDWEPIRDACYQAAGSYMSATNPAGGWDAGNQTSYERTTTSTNAQQLVDSASRDLDAFYDRHRRELDGAAARSAAVGTNADAALMAAQHARQRLSETDPRFRGYPSIQSAGTQVEVEARAVLSARDRGDLVAAEGASARLVDAATALNGALDKAPEQQEQAKRTIASLRTRMQALRNRADGMGEVRSGLLREFRADSSADLVRNDVACREHLDKADAFLRSAVAAATELRPETALDFAKQSRAELSEAELLIDALTDRLHLLRKLRAEPGAREREVRFKLRDAQRLALDRDAVTEWGQALDAQVSRIDRIVAALGERNPDYWAYDRAMADVSTFIASIVSRIRQKSVQ